jgi:hypothetical protein
MATTPPEEPSEMPEWMWVFLAIDAALTLLTLAAVLF